MLYVAVEDAARIVDGQVERRIREAIDDDERAEVVDTRRVVNKSERGVGVERAQRKLNACALDRVDDRETLRRIANSRSLHPAHTRVERLGERKMCRILK